MKPLNYNIYTNINDNTFITVCRALTRIESQMFKILNPGGWNLHSPVANSDGLNVDFLKRDSDLKGNIALLFEDKPRKVTFTMGISKSFDENGFRYFYKTDIFEGKELEFFEDRISDFTALCLTTYEGITKENIISLGEIIKLSDYKGV